MKPWYEVDSDAAAAQLGTDPERGLTASDAARRLAVDGPNELVDSGVRSAWTIAWEQLTATMVVLLIVAAAVSVAVGDYKDAVAILAIVVLNAVLGFYQEFQAEKAIAALKKLAVPHVKVRRDGHVLEISARDLVVGDVMLLEAGNIVAADGRVVGAANLRTQEAALTGESQPVEKDPAAISAPDDGSAVVVGDRRNMVFMGTAVTYGRGHAVVTDTGMRTQLGAIATMLQAVHREPTPLQRRLDQLGGRLAARGSRDRCRDVRHGPRAWRGSQGHVPDGCQHGGGGRPRGVARCRHDRARTGRATNVAATRPHPQACGGRNAGFGDRHLLRQNRNAHREPHASRHPGRGGTTCRTR